MLQARGLSFAPDPLVGNLFENLEISLDAGEKVALIGRNGAGKTKLLEILAGTLRPGTGRVVHGSGSRIAYLRQDFELEYPGTLEQFLLSQKSFEDTDLAAFEARLRKVVSRLQIDRTLMERPYPLLSLGERMRAQIATLLLDEPDILLLDEPTNHLDLDARLWLERFLSSCPQAVLFVCHDRSMIDAVADRTLELENGILTSYAGGYEDLLTAKHEKNERLQEAWERSRQETRRLKNAAEKTLQKAAGMSKKPTQRTYDPKHKAFYAGKEKKLDQRAKAIRTRVEQAARNPLEKPVQPDSVALAFTGKPLRTSDALTVRGLSKNFGDRFLFRDLSFSLGAQERVALIGSNGCGKSTLLRILLAEEPSSGGEFQWAHGAKPAYLSQSRGELDYGKSILEALEVQSPDTEFRARTLLGRLRLRGDAVLKKVGVLSVGERTKVELVRILLSDANVLLLDEPTNHLDIDSLEALEEALNDFPGAVLFTSHDRTFVNRLADHNSQIELRATS